MSTQFKSTMLRCTSKRSRKELREYRVTVDYWPSGTADVRVAYGRLGAANTERFIEKNQNYSSAEAIAERLIAVKLKKGYVIHTKFEFPEPERPRPSQLFDAQPFAPASVSQTNAALLGLIHPRKRAFEVSI